MSYTAFMVHDMTNPSVIFMHTYMTLKSQFRHALSLLLIIDLFCPIAKGIHYSTTSQTL